MARTLDSIMDDLPAERREAIMARSDAIMREIDGLQALRTYVRRSQADLARRLGVKQPAVHRMEKQADLYVSTLRRYVEAAGGTLELHVTLPGKETVKLSGIADLE